MKVLVTGANGVFGPHMVRELVNFGHETVIFTRQKPGDEFEKQQWIQGDINNIDDCLRAMDKSKVKFDAVVNLAAKPNPTDHPKISREYGDSKAFPITMQTNIIGLYNMLQASVRNDTGIFVHTSSNCTLGHGFRISSRPYEIKYLPIDENHPLDPEDSYSFSKVAGEQLIKSFANAYGIKGYAVRSAGICDAERRLFMKEHRRQAKGWNEWLMVWIASEDLASAHRLLMENADKLPDFDEYFCNNDDSTTLTPTMEIIEKYRPDLLPVTLGIQGFDSLITCNKLKNACGWKPRESWRDL